jgi:hypothetical protein
MFSVTACHWTGLIDRMASHPDGLWNEVAMGGAMRDLGLDVLRLSIGPAMLTQDSTGHWIRDIDGTGLDLYCCEPSRGNMGFGHYSQPGGYRPIMVDHRGVVSTRRT